MSLVREDQYGVYIIINGSKHRPGNVVGYDHAFDMSDGGLRAGQKVKASSVSQSPLCRIKTDGRVLYWASPSSLWGVDQPISAEQS